MKWPAAQTPWGKAGIVLPRLFSRGRGGGISATFSSVFCKNGGRGILKVKNKSCVDKCFVNNHVNKSDVLGYGFQTEDVSIPMAEVEFWPPYWNLALKL